MMGVWSLHGPHQSAWKLRRRMPSLVEAVLSEQETVKQTTRTSRIRNSTVGESAARSISFCRCLRVLEASRGMFLFSLLYRSRSRVTRLTPSRAPTAGWPAGFLRCCAQASRRLRLGVKRRNVPFLTGSGMNSLAGHAARLLKTWCRHADGLIACQRVCVK